MIDPRIRALLKLVPALPHDLPVTEQRRRLGEVFAPLAPAERTAPQLAVEDHVLDGPGGPLPVRVHLPPRRTVEAALVQLPGGAFRFGGLDAAAGPAAVRAQVLGCPVVTVEHRLAPEHPFPAAVDDVWCALRWAADRAARLLVAGISAGASLALAAALRARDAGGPRIAALVLEVPAVDPGLAHPSVRTMADDPLLPRPALERMWHDYLPAGSRHHPWAAPLTTDLGRLPPTLVVTAEHDPLRDEGEALAARMREAGTPAAALRVAGTVHGLQTTPLTEEGEAAHARILGFLAGAGRISGRAAP